MLSTIAATVCRWTDFTSLLGLWGTAETAPTSGRGGNQFSPITSTVYESRTLHNWMLNTTHQCNLAGSRRASIWLELHQEKWLGVGKIVAAGAGWWFESREANVDLKIAGKKRCAWVLMWIVRLFVCTVVTRRGGGGCDAVGHLGNYAKKKVIKRWTSFTFKKKKRLFKCLSLLTNKRIHQEVSYFSFTFVPLHLLWYHYTLKWHLEITHIPKVQLELKKKNRSVSSFCVIR